MGKFNVGDKVKFVKSLHNTESCVPLGEVGVITDIEEPYDGLTICVTYRYKQLDFDYEWFMEDELELVND